MKRILNFIIIYAVLVSSAFASIPFKPNTNEFVLGRGADGDNKLLTVNIGDGGTNPVLLINDTLKVFNFNKGLDVTGAGVFSGNLSGVDGTFTGVLKSEGASYSLGNGTNQDLNINFDMNGTADIPAIKYDSASGEILIKKKVGANFKKVGSGSGGGGGENFNNGFGDDDNANAEDGTANWSNSGGTFAITTTDPLEGEQSFIYTASAQNNYVESGVLSFDKDLFRGNACEARVEYIGGDENLSLQVVNGNATVIAEQVLPAHSIFGQESAFFICPNETDILGDANLGSLRYRITNVGAVAAPLIKFDKSYMGTLRGLVETTLPDVFSARISSTGTTDSNSGTSWMVSSKIGTGDYELDISQMGLANKLACTSTASQSGFGSVKDCDVQDASTNSLIKIRCHNDGGTGAAQDSPFEIVCQKQGTDAKQSVQVYKSIPKVSENINQFNGHIDQATGNILSENVPWLGTAVYATGEWTLPFNAGTFSSAPNCVATSNDSGGSRDLRIYAETPTSIKVATYGGGGVSQYGFYIHCARVGDFKTGLTQNISLAGIVVNSAAEQSQKQTRLESCKVFNNGTATINNASGLCYWVESVTRTAAGLVSLIYKPGIFSAQPDCLADSIPGNNSDGDVDSYDHGLRKIVIITEDSGTGNVDHDSAIICSGAK